MTVSPTPSPSDIVILQLNFAECAVERNSLISQKQMCMIEKEVCLNQTEVMASNAYLEKQEAVLQVNNLEYYQRVILGVLIAIAGLSLCINFCFCVRELRSFLIRKRKVQKSKLNERSLSTPSIEDTEGVMLPQTVLVSQSEQKDTNLPV